ncbi:MAG TPA: response regulator, partial [Kofleriaceae bacterium]|jgi:two-component system sensor histidine kinase and response regulator WspE|nr:response regulator [Kofleriaceae bacterium]
LLVDDSDIIRESLRRLLSEAGYVVTVAVDGMHGLELAKSRRFDLVSTDVMMPRMDGYELTRALRAMPEYADAPIVMVTSKDEKIDRVRGFDAGVDEYITKPHDRSQLLRVVRKLLGHAQSGDETS